MHVSLLKRARASLINATFAKISLLEIVTTDEIAAKLRLITQKALGNGTDTAEVKEILHTFNISVNFRDFRFERRRELDFHVKIKILYQRKIKGLVYLYDL